MSKNYKLEKITKILASIFLFSLLFWDYTIVYRAILVVLGALTLLLILSRRRIVISPVFIGYSIFTFFCLMHTLLGFSVAPDNSMAYCKTLLMNDAIVLILTNIILSRKDIFLMIKTFIISSLIGTIYIFIYNIGSGSFSTVIPYLFFSSNYYSHNDIPLLATISVALILYLYQTDKEKNKKYLFILPLFVLLIPISGARKSFIFLLFIFFYFYVFFSKKRKLGSIFIRTFIILSVITGVVILCFTNDVLYEYIGSRFEGAINGLIGEEFTEGSAESRSIMIELALELISKKPLLGHGINSFPYYHSMIGGEGTWSHNNYLELFVSGGVFLPIIYYSLHLYFAGSLIKQKSSNEKKLFVLILLYICLIHDNLSVSYLHRTIIVLLVLIDRYIMTFKFRESEYLLDDKKIDK